jgi:O-antigen ligase
MTLRLRHVEHGSLLALCLFLPLFEAPKSLAWLVFVIAWFATRSRTKDYGGPWDVWDTVIASWIAAAVASALFSDTQAREWRGASDVIRYASVLWLLKRSALEMQQVRWLLWALVASATLGLAWSYLRLWAGAEYLQLNSVGHVNHSAIYLAIMFGVALSWFLAGNRWMGLFAAFFLISLFVAASRAAVAAAVILLVALSLVRRTRSAMIGGAIALIVVSAAAVLGQAHVLRKQIESAKADNMLAHREGVWAIAVETWLRHPLFGAGMGNFGAIAREQARETRAALGEKYDATQHYDVGHAHSLYLNTLAERGAVGALALIAFLSIWAIFLLRFYPIAARNENEWLLWALSASAWTVTSLVGLVNTTLHHEHALLSVLLLGVWLGRLRSSHPAHGPGDTLAR